MLLCLASYEQCSTRPLKVLHKCCNTDVLGVLLIYLHPPSCARDHAYISVKPLVAMLQHIIYMCVCICVCVCIYVCITYIPKLRIWCRNIPEQNCMYFCLHKVRTYMQFVNLIIYSNTIAFFWLISFN